MSTATKELSTSLKAGGGVTFWERVQAGIPATSILWRKRVARGPKEGKHTNHLIRRAERTWQTSEGSPAVALAGVIYNEKASACTTPSV